MLYIHIKREIYNSYLLILALVILQTICSSPSPKLGQKISPPYATALNHVALTSRQCVTPSAQTQTWLRP